MASNTSLFGNNSSSSGVGLFGKSTNSNSASTGSGLFGNTATSNNTSSGSNLFGNTSSTNTTSAGGSLFGNPSNTNATSTGTSLFGNTNSNNTASTGTGLFGNTAAANTSSTGNSLFGNTNTANTTTTGTSLFGNTNSNNTTSTGTSLFGNTNTANTTTTGTSLFGNTNSNNTTSTGTGLFGNTNTANTSSTGTGLFGNTNTVNTSSTGTGLFGNTNTANSNSTGTGLFGNASTNSTSGTGLLGNTSNSISSNIFGNSGSNTTINSTQTPTASLPASQINRNTNFSDLPEQTKQALINIELMKKKQMDISTLLRPENVISQIESIKRQTFVLEQNLASLKLTIENSKKKVDIDKESINTIYRETDRAITVISQAMDDSNWEVNNLSALQMAQRQSAISNNNYPFTSITSSNPQNQNQQQQQQQQQHQLNPTEASRRIQYILMNSNLTIDFFGKWLINAEQKFQQIQSSLESLERFINPIYLDLSKPKPNTDYIKKLNEVVRNQSESLIGLGRKLSQINDEFTKLSREP
ncbi:Nuclear pore complex protein Nup98-Nup96 [Smittium mucronatum]|uniref:Nuclear pore complex protein Nup98-Nup96 n=1 Tax=Smittium mucronatum TaxID=133383 RepID=A0A1R0GXB2_9FUNG|nr:Nuclear pore complex protein Nup98-Nup96 [Smittium mucronatum]